MNTKRLKTSLLGEYGSIDCLGMEFHRKFRRYKIEQQKICTLNETNFK